MMNSGERVMGQTSGTGGGAGTTPPAGKAMRVYEIARELGVENKEFLAKSRALGIDAKNHMSLLGPEDVARVKRGFDKERPAGLVEERVGDGTVIRRRSRGGAAPAAPRPSAPPPVEKPASAPRAKAPKVDVAPPPPAPEPEEVAAPPPPPVREEKIEAPAPLEEAP